MGFAIVLWLYLIYSLSFKIKKCDITERGLLKLQIKENEIQIYSSNNFLFLFFNNKNTNYMAESVSKLPQHKLELKRHCAFVITTLIFNRLSIIYDQRLANTSTRSIL